MDKFAALESRMSRTSQIVAPASVSIGFPASEPSDPGGANNATATSSSLKRTTSIEVQLGGWNGRRALGGVLIGTLDDDTDVFIAAPKTLDAAWTDLLTHYDTPDATEKKQVVVKDEYQGDVLLTRNTSLILGIVAYADLASAKRLADVLLAEL